MTDSEIHDIADDFKSQYMHGGTTFDEFDYLGFAKAILARQGTASGPQAPSDILERAARQCEKRADCGGPMQAMARQCAKDIRGMK